MENKGKQKAHETVQKSKLCVGISNSRLNQKATNMPIRSRKPKEDRKRKNDLQNRKIYIC